MTLREQWCPFPLFQDDGGLSVSHSRVYVAHGGWLHKSLPFRMLEPCEVNVSHTVLRGLGAGNSPWLPGAPYRVSEYPKLCVIE